MVVFPHNVLYFYCPVLSTFVCCGRTVSKLNSIGAYISLQLALLFIATRPLAVVFLHQSLLRSLYRYYPLHRHRSTRNYPFRLHSNTDTISEIIDLLSFTSAITMVLLAFLLGRKYCHGLHIRSLDFSTKVLLSSLHPKRGSKSKEMRRCCHYQCSSTKSLYSRRNATK